MGKFVLQNLTFEYEGHYVPVFKNVSLEIDASWKLGLVGRNGRGKTTLLKLLHGALAPTSGRLFSGINTELYPYDLNNRRSKVMDFIQANICGEIMPYMIEREFNLMGLDLGLLDRDWGSLSGGERTKIQIVILYLRNPEFVLFDEPTTHLDSRGRADLARYLAKKQGYIIVSHDAEFLDAAIDRVLSINKSNIYLEKGNFTSWKRNKDEYEEYEKRQKANLTRKVTQLQKTAKNTRSWSDHSNTKKYAFRTSSRNRSLGIMKRAITAEKRIDRKIGIMSDMLKNYEVAARLEFAQEDASSAVLIRAEGIGHGFANKALFCDLHFEVRKGDRIHISGENGSGKSTLLNIIAGRLAPAQGVLTFSKDLLISYSTQIPLAPAGEIDENIAEMLDIDEDMLLRPFETLSDGERKKIDIARAFSRRNNLIILDEPLNFTDVYFREQLEEAILNIEPTMIFVEHDRRFCGALATKVIELGSC
ncbi:MAG: ATP-binding cassette domain-containing protein [Clostridiales bacterium]|jgi:lincosamide and streptogramin A transport system ATP-binding/permease protein|nr:ATP-binding cassette domain-containing protein [Clostridiales bacterium]